MLFNFWCQQFHQLWSMTCVYLYHFSIMNSLCLCKKKNWVWIKRGQQVTAGKTAETFVFCLFNQCLINLSCCLLFVSRVDNKYFHIHSDKMYPKVCFIIFNMDSAPSCCLLSVSEQLSIPALVPTCSGTYTEGQKSINAKVAFTPLRFYLVISLFPEDTQFAKLSITSHIQTHLL